MQERTSRSLADVNATGNAWRITGIREGDTDPMATGPLTAQVRVEVWTPDGYHLMVCRAADARLLAAHLVEMAEHADGRTAAFTCPACLRTSYHPEDGRQGYCGACHAYTGADHHYSGDPTP